MTEKKQELAQIKRDPANEVQRINLGWKGYVPGYKNRAIKQINRSIEEQAAGINTPGKLSESGSRGSMKPEGSAEKSGGPAGQFTREVNLNTNEPKPVENETKEPGSSPNQLGDSSVAGGGSMSAAEEIQAEEIAEAEEDYANQLASEQELSRIQKYAEGLREKGKSFGHPSIVKYGVLFASAAIVDGVDLLHLTGIGVFIGWVVTILGTGLIISILWFTNGRLKRAHEYSKNLEAELVALQKDIARLTKYGLKASRAMRRIPGMKGVARQIPRAMVKIRRLARKNPVTKVLVGGAINMIPFIAIFNLMIVWVYLSYRDEKSAYRNAKEQAEEAYQSISATATEMV